MDVHAEELAAINNEAAEVLENQQQEAALDETFALAAEPQKVNHGVDHIKSRLILATTAWNNGFGYKRGVNLLTTLFVSENWPLIKDEVVKDVEHDAANLEAVMWKPVAYLINEIVTGNTSHDGHTFAAVLTTGQYVYLKLEGHNFKLINSSVDMVEDTVVPAVKIIMLRETGVVVEVNQSSDLDDSKYIRALAPQKMAGPRYTVKEAADARHDKKMLDKRRKANKAAKAQKRKARK